MENWYIPFKPNALLTSLTEQPCFSLEVLYASLAIALALVALFSASLLATVSGEQE